MRRVDPSVNSQQARDGEVGDAWCNACLKHGGPCRALLSDGCTRTSVVESDSSVVYVRNIYYGLLHAEWVNNSE